jgi:hypothetical protein
MFIYSLQKPVLHKIVVVVVDTRALAVILLAVVRVSASAEYLMTVVCTYAFHWLDK